MLDLNTDIKFLKGVGEKKANLLKKELSVSCVEDLLYYFPYKYVDKTKFYSIRDIREELPYIQLKGKILELSKEGQGRKERLTGIFSDGTGTIQLVWFQGIKWILTSIRPGVEYIVYGKPTSFRGGFSIAHPEIEEFTENEDGVNSSLEAHYVTTEKLKRGYISSKVIHKLQRNALTILGDQIPETLPGYVLRELKLPPLWEALLNIHFPITPSMLKKANYRIKFEEFLYFQINLFMQRQERTEKLSGHVFKAVGNYFHTFYHHVLTFELTNAQKKVMKEIRKDVGSGKQMNRLLQGDVGSGKTLVAFMSILLALDNGYQACLMAPTEILAQQHFFTLSQYCSQLDITIGLLTGSTKKKERNKIHEGLRDGSLQIITGTHALIEDEVLFSNLGLAIIDEQHRFGVIQRAGLRKKNKIPPHVLVMTATPIPRTLQMTLYGDLDVSVIDELPPGRKPVKTFHAYDSNRLKIFQFLREQIAAGRQVYVVYPLIYESESMDYKDLEDGYQSISKAFPPPEYLVSIVHGQMTPDKKERSMQLFVSGQAHILVATTVIEVGVDVPNASVMVIESAERFGLSQLHQLRGRVGRGADQSYCVLMTSFKLTKEAKKRINTMVETGDGFKIAEEDLKLRGPGDVEGTQQSGLPAYFRLANLATDGEILQHARHIARDIIARDPHLQHPQNTVIKKQLSNMKKERVNWRNVG